MTSPYSVLGVQPVSSSLCRSTWSSSSLRNTMNLLELTAIDVQTRTSRRCETLKDTEFLCRNKSIFYSCYK